MQAHLIDLAIKLWPLLAMAVPMAVAFRGKGGGFVTWGITPLGDDNLAHALGAVLAALSIVAVTQLFYWFPVFAGLWFLFSRISPHWALNAITTPSFDTFCGAIARQLLAVPIGVALYLTLQGHANPLGFLVAPFLGLIYVLGGQLLRAKLIPDGVEFAEWWTGPGVALMLFIIMR